MTLLFAHLGHWYVSLPIWLGPFALLFGWAKIAERREKAKQRDAPPAPARAPLKRR